MTAIDTNLLAYGKIGPVGNDTPAAHHDRARYRTALREIKKLAEEALTRD